MSASVRIVVVTVIVGAIGLLALIFGPNPMFDASRPVINRSSGPTSVEYARKHCPIPIEFPDGARNIQFGASREWVGYEDFVKYEASPEECIDMARRILAASLDPRQTSDSEGLHPMAAPLKGFISKKFTSTQLSGPAWFDPENISDGLEGSGSAGVRDTSGGLGIGGACGPVLWPSLILGYPQPP
jgi:hypothetical protein